MESDIRKLFEKWLEIYQLRKDVEWDGVIRCLVAINDKVLRRFVNEIASSKLSDTDCRDLLHLIRMFDRCKNIDVIGQTETIRIGQGNLQKWLRLSLHKILYQTLEMDIIDEEGVKTIVGTEDMVEVRQPLKVGHSCFRGYVEAFPSDTIDDLLKLYEGNIYDNKIRTQRSELDIVALGLDVIELSIRFPQEILQQMNKTELLNFCGDILGVVRNLTKLEKWVNYSLELNERPAYMTTGDLRRSRMKIVEHWVKAAIKYVRSSPDIELAFCDVMELCQERVKVLNSLFTEGTGEGD